MDNPIFEEYIQELHNINPTINDFFMRDEWNDKNHIQPNVYSSEYDHKYLKLCKLFLKKLKKKNYHSMKKSLKMI